MALAKRTGRHRNRLRFPPYGKELFARRMADEHIGLCVIAAGSFDAGLHYAGNPRVHRLVAPLDLDLDHTDWRVLIDLDVLVCPAASAPGAWLDKLMRSIFQADPRMVFCEFASEEWDGKFETGIFRVRATPNDWCASGMDPPMAPDNLPGYIARMSRTIRQAGNAYRGMTGDDPDFGWIRK